MKYSKDRKITSLEYKIAESVKEVTDRIKERKLKLEEQLYQNKLIKKMMDESIIYQVTSTESAETEIKILKDNDIIIPTNASALIIPKEIKIKKGNRDRFIDF